MKRSLQAAIGDAAGAARAGRRSASRRSLPTRRGSSVDRERQIRDGADGERAPAFITG
jgi:hypothetical protein